MLKLIVEEVALIPATVPLSIKVLVAKTEVPVQIAKFPITPLPVTLPPAVPQAPTVVKRPPAPAWTQPPLVKLETVKLPTKLVVAKLVTAVKVALVKVGLEVRVILVVVPISTFTPSPAPKDKLELVKVKLPKAVVAVPPLTTGSTPVTPRLIIPGVLVLTLIFWPAAKLVTTHSGLSPAVVVEAAKICPCITGRVARG